MKRWEGGGSAANAHDGLAVATYSNSLLSRVAVHPQQADVSPAAAHPPVHGHAAGVHLQGLQMAPQRGESSLEQVAKDKHIHLQQAMGASAAGGDLGAQASMMVVSHRKRDCCHT